jgi:two-component sensor histidine kinase
MITGEKRTVPSLIDSTLTDDISVHGNFENVAVTPREASIVGTIVNELAANASKHSLTRSSRKIELSAKRSGKNGYLLVCSDDAGARDHEQARSSGRIGLGLKILSASVRQLGGTMTATHTDQGYSTRINFSFSSVPKSRH